jgi:hypothetical protein
MGLIRLSDMKRFPWPTIVVMAVAGLLCIWLLYLAAHGYCFYGDDGPLRPLP